MSPPALLPPARCWSSSPSGKVTKKVRATLVRGKAVVALPKVTRGSWKLAATYRGDANYDARSARVVKLGRLG